MKVGIVSPWYERGIGIISLNMWQAIRQSFDVHVLAPNWPRPMGAAFDVPNLMRDDDQFRYPLEWAQEWDLDVLLFNERLDCRQLRPLREHTKLVGLLQWEFVPRTKKAAAWINSCYHAVIAPTLPAAQAYKEIGIENVTLVPWGTDLEMFRPPDAPRSGPLTFLQPANFGGLHGRKGAAETERAWFYARTGDAKLIIHDQHQDPRTHAEMSELYQQADVVLLPSQWEGLGLTFIEALASGCAIVTVDAMPMNDYVIDMDNGLLCEAEMMPPPHGIYVDRAVIDVGDYVSKIEWLAWHPDEAREMGRRSRMFAERHYNWAERGQKLAQLLESIV